MSGRELRGITPTYQNLLINQLNGIAEAINMGRILEAFVRLRTLIMTLNPQHKKELKENHVVHIEEKMQDIQELESTDYYRTGKLHKGRLREIAPEVLTLFEKVMEVLHEGHYLEIRGTKYPISYEKGLRQVAKQKP